ncbi:MAG: hypothetical protein ACTSRC_21850 [Candidatus Helarchaeota archaeon]
MLDDSASVVTEILSIITASIAIIGIGLAINYDTGVDKEIKETFSYILAGIFLLFFFFAFFVSGFWLIGVD